MWSRSVWFSFLLVTVAFAADQAASTKPGVPAQPDSQGKTERAHPRIRFGGLMIGAGYSHFSGGFPYGYYGDYPGYYRYDPFLWTSFYHRGYLTGYAYQPNMGDINIRVPDKTAQVFLDGALAGRVEDLKNMWLEPGAYQLEIRGSGRKFTQKIYVLSGKTFKVTPDMMIVEALQQ